MNAPAEKVAIAPVRRRQTLNRVVHESAGRLRSARSFILLETMLGVLIFSIGVLALGHCVNNCILGEGAKAEDQRARLALENRMAEIEAGAERLSSDSTSDDLKGMFTGITLRQTRRALKEKNENDQDLTGLYEIQLEAHWKSRGRDTSRQLSFYVYRNQLGD